MKLWTNDVNALFVWNTEISKAYLWNTEIYSSWNPFSLDDRIYLWQSAYVSGLSPTAFTMSEDWKYMYIKSGSSNYIDQYELTTPWDPTTLNINSIWSSLSISDITAIAFNKTWTRLYLSRLTWTTVKSIQEHTLSTPWMISTMSASYRTKQAFSSSSTTYVRGIFINDNERTMIISYDYLAKISLPSTGNLSWSTLSLEWRISWGTNALFLDSTWTFWINYRWWNYVAPATLSQAYNTQTLTKWDDISLSEWDSWEKVFVNRKWTKLYKVSNYRLYAYELK